MASQHTCIVMYAIDATVTLVMLCNFALPFFVALDAWSTELGDVNMCLYTYDEFDLAQLGIKLIHYSP